MYKKIIAVSLLGLFLAPMAVVAQGGQGLVDIPSDIQITTCQIRHNVNVLGDKFQGCTKGSIASYATQAHCCLVDRILTFIDWFFWALIIISFMILLVGAFHILTAGGNPDKVALGRKFITFAIVGIALAVLTFVIPRMVIRIVY